MIWFALGALLGLIAIIVLYVLPPKGATAPARVLSGKQKQDNTPPYLPSEDVATRPPEALWYYLDKENNQYGPMSFNALKSAWNHKEIDPCTYVWNENMEEWKTLENLPDALERIQT
ncbi:MAG: DUF4339 domain-containing protein [Candidatus Neptunochlamydia sp.]|nr:DUF4339 domain-containing protein [Candidatus Neptunochlamydia sp.]